MFACRRKINSETTESLITLQETSAENSLTTAKLRRQLHISRPICIIIFLTHGRQTRMYKSMQNSTVASIASFILHRFVSEGASRCQMRLASCLSPLNSKLSRVGRGYSWMGNRPPGYSPVLILRKTWNSCE